MENGFLTLDEIGVQHDTRQAEIIGKSHDRIFDNIPEAGQYTSWCIKKALENLKVKIDPKMPPDIMEMALGEKGVEIQQYKSNEHTGTYIYRKNLLEYFISDIEKKTGDIIFHKEKWVVRTNVN